MSAFSLSGLADFYSFLQASGLLMGVLYPLIGAVLLIAYFFISLFI